MPATLTAPELAPWIADNLGHLVADLGARSARSFESALAPLGLRPRHHAVLSHLAHHGPSASQREVGGCLDIDRSSMVTVVDELEQLGLIVRTRDQTDRRRHLLRLTAAGQRMLKRSRAAGAAVEQDLLSALTAAEQTQLRALLQTVRQATADG